MAPTSQSNANASPRILSTHLPRFRDRTVHLVGRVVSAQGHSAIIKGVDNADVTVFIKPGSQASVARTVVDVLGIVERDLSVKEIMSVTLCESEDKFDFEGHRKMIELLHGESPLFYPS